MKILKNGVPVPSRFYGDIDLDNVPGKFINQDDIEIFQAWRERKSYLSYVREGIEHEYDGGTMEW